MTAVFSYRIESALETIARAMERIAQSTGPRILVIAQYSGHQHELGYYHISQLGIVVTAYRSSIRGYALVGNEFYPDQPTTYVLQFQPQDVVA